jgi:two-component system sensor histidine kinase/response regulator
MNANILVVDDTPENLQLLMGILAGQGYDVRLAPDGCLALKFARTTPPDLILLDIKMPEMDGYEVCKLLKADERTREIPVLFLSASHKVSDKVKGLEVGGVDYITKPFQIEEVLARVHTHLALRNAQKGLQEEIIRRKQTEEELREANASKDKFFSIIAHDLRNPFNVLLTLTELLTEEFERYEPERRHALLRRLNTSSRQVYALLTNLLEWSRLERGLIDCQPETLSLADIVEGHTYLLALHADQKQITLHNLIPAGTTAYADRKMIEMIIRNLISNSLKFTGNGGTITISAQCHEHTVEIAVVDTGIGMEQGFLANLFRLDKKCSRSGTIGEQGTGLGLILCKELAEKNGGSIRVESEVGKGSRFTVSLPRKA